MTWTNKTSAMITERWFYRERLLFEMMFCIDIQLQHQIIFRERNEETKAYFSIFLSFTWTCKSIIALFMYNTITSLAFITLIGKSPSKQSQFSSIFSLIPLNLPKKIIANSTKCRQFENLRDKFMTKMLINTLPSFCKST